MFDIKATKPTEDRLKETEQVKTSKEYIRSSESGTGIHNAARQGNKKQFVQKLSVYSTVRLTSMIQDQVIRVVNVST